MSQEQQLEQVELSIKQAKATIERRNSLDKLFSNEHFKAIILKGYFEEEASRLVLIKASPAMQTDESQTQINKSIDAVGFLRQHFHMIAQTGNMAERALADDQNTREELLASGL